MTATTTDREDQHHDGGQDELDDGDDSGRPGLLKAGLTPTGGLDPRLALLARISATIAATGRQTKNPAPPLHQRLGNQFKKRY